MLNPVPVVPAGMIVTWVAVMGPVDAAVPVPFDAAGPAPFDAAARWPWTATSAPPTTLAYVVETVRSSLVVELVSMVSVVPDGVDKVITPAEVSVVTFPMTNGACCALVVAPAGMVKCPASGVLPDFMLEARTETDEACNLPSVLRVPTALIRVPEARSVTNPVDTCNSL